MIKIKCLKKMTAVLIAALAISVPACDAQEFTGYAFIKNGNVEEARAMAKNDAKRNFIEQSVGVHIQSQSEMANFLVIKDVVISKSEGFVVVKRVISEKINGDVISVTLDLEHGSKPFELAPNDIAAQLENLSENSSRNGIDLAIIDSNAKDTRAYNDYLAHRLNSAGFTANANDAALDYLGKNMQADDLTLNAGVRQAGRQELMRGNAIIRGRVSIARQAEMIAPGVYRAVAEIACQIVSYDSNAVDSVALYADDVGRTPEEAVKHAKDKVVSDAVRELAKSAARTIQRESRGDALVVKTVLIFEGIYDKANEPNVILNAVQNSGCRIVRSALAANGTLQILVAYNAMGTENSNTVANKVRDALQEVYTGILPPMESGGIGAVKYIIKLRG